MNVTMTRPYLQTVSREGTVEAQEDMGVFFTPWPLLRTVVLFVLPAQHLSHPTSAKSVAVTSGALSVPHRGLDLPDHSACLAVAGLLSTTI